MNLIWKTIYIIILSFLLFSFPNDASAKCEGPMPIIYGSTTCYCNYGSPDSGEWIIEVSVNTLKELEIEKGLASATIKNVRRVLERNKVKSGGIFYNYNSSNRLEKQDCKIYAMVSRGVIDKRKIIIEHFTFDCIGDATYFAHRVAKIIDRKSQNISGLDKVLFRTFPKQQFSTAARKNKFGLSFLIANSKAMKSHIFDSTIPEVARLQKEFIAYPYSLYEVKEGDTLSAVAAIMTGSSENWPVLWALNAAKLRGVRDLVVGEPIKVPASIEKWNTTDIKWQSKESIALKQYGTSELTELVEKICSDTKVATHESSCSLPQFSNLHGFEKLYPGLKREH